VERFRQPSLRGGPSAKLTASSGTLANPFQYTARESDTETGIYDYRARYYDQNVGRFISEDPLRFDAGVNFYAYVRNSPLVWNDPSGLVKCMYSIGQHTLDCSTDDGSMQYSSDHVSSGRYDCRNNVACQSTPDNGPIPVGKYRMGPLGKTPNPHKVPRIMLYPSADTNTYRRFGFEVHPGWNDQSQGCITIQPPDYPGFTKFYLHDNSGTTTVIP
jgi:RHS repeat-associated protein